MIYFTSDLHLGHRAVLDFQKRPFADVDEMNRTLIANINALVRKDDILYLLGDVTHRCPVDEANRLISKMNGRKYLIRGNHDKNYDDSLFEGVCDFYELREAGHIISLMHYPMLEWPKSRYKGIHLHGHRHNGPEYNEEQRSRGIRRYDVGMDANYYYPVALRDILRFMGE